LLHIDGHHSYESVRNDFGSWIAKVRPGGVILLHDVSIRNGGFGVWRFWEELCAEFPHFTFAHSAGLGVAVKPGTNSSGGFSAGLVAANAEEQASIGGYYVSLGERFQLAFDNAQLRKQAAAPGLCSVQVYYSVGGCYTEANSAVQIAQVGKQQRLSFELPAGIPNAPLRIDPSDRVGIVEIREICISNAERSRVLWKWSATEPEPALQVDGTARLIAGKRGVTLVSYGSDPQLLLTDVGGTRFDRPLALQLELQVTPYVEFDGRMVPLSDVDRFDTISAAPNRDEPSESGGGDEELMELRNKLEGERMRGDALENSWSWRVTAPARSLLDGVLRKRNH
jgi:hypothetical protein